MEQQKECCFRKENSAERDPRQDVCAAARFQFLTKKTTFINGL
jgi:hypothetical protein